MKNISIISALMSFALMLPASVSAQPVEEKKITKSAYQLDPGAGYIFLHATSRYSAYFLRKPNAAEVAEYEIEWETAYAKELRKYEKRLKSYPEDLKWARQKRMELPPKPIEPTRENFSIGAIEMRHPVSIGPMFAFRKDKGAIGETYTYLSKVEPGIYIYYGALIAGQKSAMIGECMCMGTVQFEVKPGIVTDLGDIIQKSFIPAEEANSAPAGSFILRVDSVTKPPPATFGLPDSIAHLANAPVELHASGKLDNVFGIGINRMPPIAEILAYDRDMIIDVRTGRPVPPTSR